MLFINGIHDAQHFYGLLTYASKWVTCGLPTIRTMTALMNSRCLIGTLRQKYMKVRGGRLRAQLPDHQCDLTSMISGMVRQMLHQVRQSNLGCPKRKYLFQDFICNVIHELNLLLFDFRPL
jgi:hypothetical protein